MSTSPCRRRLYLYEANTHTLVPVMGKDLREDTGKQGFVKDRR